MFKSFFPRPKLYFASFAVWSLLCVCAWFFIFRDLGDSLSLGPLFGMGFQELPTEPNAEISEALKSAQIYAENFYFYQYFIITILLFCGFWFWYSPHKWQRWSVAGSAVIIFVNWFLVQLDVMINEWFGDFYNLIQKALGAPNSVTGEEYYWTIFTFLQIAMVYVFVATIFRFFVSHYVFRWRNAMNDYYMRHWPKLRHIEGASQRVQEDTQRFASITEGLGLSFVDSLMTLIAFLPLLWGLSAQVTELPIIGEVGQGLVFVVIIWSVFGTALVAVAGIKLPGLQFNIQLTEAAYRKELVFGEDHEDRAQPLTVRELFDNVRHSYFRLYFHYVYFNLVRIFYLQFGNLIPYIALGPTIISGAITLGVMQQIIRAFGRVESSFQFLINSWSTIVELMSVHKRLMAFESVIGPDDLAPDEFAPGQPAQ
ncbi:peptide antibiotic transporter SbmA [Hoeflea sp. CAU 1731]